MSGRGRSAIDPLNARPMLREMFAAAMNRADPALIVPEHLPEKPAGRCILLALGDSAHAMVAAVKEAWPDVAISGVALTGAAPKSLSKWVFHQTIDCHSSPDVLRRFDDELKSAVGKAGPDDLVLVLHSSGAGSLSGAPIPRCSFADRLGLERELSAADEPLADVALIRRLLLRAGLAEVAGMSRAAGTVVFAIGEEVEEEDAADAEAVSVLQDSGLATRLPEAARKALLQGAAAEAPEILLIATPQRSLYAAARVARDNGVSPLILGDAMEGEANALGCFMGGIARGAAMHGTPAWPPLVLLSGGRSYMRGACDVGGMRAPNIEFLLSLTYFLGDRRAVHALAADTTGFDGEANAAGAYVGPDTASRAAASGIDLATALSRHQGYQVFEELGDLLRIGETEIDIGDFRAVLVL